MAGLNLVHAMIQLHRLEKEAKEGQGEVDNADVMERLGFHDEDKVTCAKGTGMALLHLPVKTSMDLAWFAVTPILTAFIVFSDFTFGAFLLFVIARMAIWAYDSALIYHGQHSEATPYNSSTLSTLMGTFPYRGNWVIGPGVTVLLDIAIVLPFSGVLGLGTLGLLGHAVEAGAVAHALLTLVTRVSLNTACAAEMFGGADRKVHRGAAWTARTVRDVVAEVGRVIRQVPTAIRAVFPETKPVREAAPWKSKAFNLRYTNPQRLDAG